MLTFGSLFSGIGGFDLGFEQAGMTCRWQCEIDTAASKVLSNHWSIPNIGDVKHVGSSTTESVDLICGGFPCQDVSIAGRREGLAGVRSGLWFEFKRIIGETRPRWVVIENVPGLLSSNRGADFATIIQGLANSGYGVGWRILDAQYFGVAQRRRRVFIVGSLGNGRAAEVLFEQESLRGNTQTRREGEEKPAYTLTASASKCGKGDGGININLIPFCMATGQSNAEIVNDGSPSLTTNHEQPIIWVNHQQDHSIRVQDQCLSPTLTRFAGTGGNNVPLVGIRRLTPVECERLQGFPDGWTAGQSDSARYRQLGNAVAVPVARWIAERIINTCYPSPTPTNTPKKG